MNAGGQITLTVNDRQYSLSVTPDMMIIDLLRDRLGLTGTKAGCRRGECGACNILVNGELFSSCLYPAIRANGKSILTIEGIRVNGQLHPLQKAFIDQGAVQCGFCTPGMIMSSKALLDRNPRPSAGDVRKALSGNLCRCGNYQRITRAVLSLSKRKDKEKNKTFNERRSSSELGTPVRKGGKIFLKLN